MQSAVIDALRSELFVQEFERLDDSWKGIGPPRRIPLQELAPGSQPLPIWTQRPLPIAWPAEVHVVAALAAAIARHASRAGASDDPLFDDALEPLYLRSPAVSPSRPEGR